MSDPTAAGSPSAGPPPVESPPVQEPTEVVAPADPPPPAPAPPPAAEPPPSATAAPEPSPAPEPAQTADPPPPAATETEPPAAAETPVDAPPEAEPSPDVVAHADPPPPGPTVEALSWVAGPGETDEAGPSPADGLRGDDPPPTGSGGTATPPLAEGEYVPGSDPDIDARLAAIQDEVGRVHERYNAGEIGFDEWNRELARLTDEANDVLDGAGGGTLPGDGGGTLPGDGGTPPVTDPPSSDEGRADDRGDPMIVTDHETGIVSRHYPDNSVEYDLPNGGQILTDPGGRAIYVRPDGSSQPAVFHESGDVTLTNPDGTTTTYPADDLPTDPLDPDGLGDGDPSGQPDSPWDPPDADDGSDPWDPGDGSDPWDPTSSSVPVEPTYPDPDGPAGTWEQEVDGDTVTFSRDGDGTMTITMTDDDGEAQTALVQRDDTTGEVVMTSTDPDLADGPEMRFPASAFEGGETHAAGLEDFGADIAHTDDATGGEADPVSVATGPEPTPGLPEALGALGDALGDVLEAGVDAVGDVLAAAGGVVDDTAESLGDAAIEVAEEPAEDADDIDEA